MEIIARVNCKNSAGITELNSFDRANFAVYLWVILKMEIGLFSKIINVR